MKRLAAIIAVAVSAFALSAGMAASSTASEPSFNRTIYVVNQSKTVSDAQVADDLVAFQAGLEDFEKYWGGSVRLKQVSAIPYRGWGITITDEVDCYGCLGYHWLRRGVPYAEAGIIPNTSWTVTFTHELFEMVADPTVNRAVNIGGRFWLTEPADPVEDDLFAYRRLGGDGTLVQISDFPTPLWYHQGLRHGKFDFTNHCKHSLQILPGGYASYWGRSKGHYGWIQVTGPGLKGRVE